MILVLERLAGRQRLFRKDQPGSLGAREGES
jgi:hypothetical protein